MTKHNIILSFLFSVIIFTSCEEHTDNQNTADNQTETIDDEVIMQRLIVGAFNDIWSNLDTAKISDYHTSDFLLLEDGVVWNNDSIVNYQLREYERMLEENYKRENKFEFIKIEKSKDAIWAAYDNFATWTVGDEITGRAHWLESAVATKTKNGWRLQMLHSTRVRN